MIIQATCDRERISPIREFLRQFSELEIIGLVICGKLQTGDP